MFFRRFLPVLLCLALSMGSCQFRGEPREESTLPEISVSARPAAAPSPGSYYNSHCRLALVLDEQGAFAMFAGDELLKGTYSLLGDGLLFCSGSEELQARMEDEGILFEDMAGLFLPVGVAESFSALGVVLQRDREYSSLQEGKWQVCDYGLGLSFIYPGDMSAPEGLLADAAVVWDGSSGYVVGRNLGESFSGSAGELLSSYMESSVPGDLSLLCAEDFRWAESELLQENIPGRLASAEGVLESSSRRVYVKVIMYTSTYADGTVNYICKAFYAPEGDSAAFNALANGVTDMTAVRRQ